MRLFFCRPACIRCVIGTRTIKRISCLIFVVVCFRVREQIVQSDLDNEMRLFGASAHAEHVSHVPKSEAPQRSKKERAKEGKEGVADLRGFIDDLLQTSSAKQADENRILHIVSPSVDDVTKAADTSDLRPPPWKKLTHEALGDEGTDAFALYTSVSRLDGDGSETTSRISLWHEVPLTAHAAKSPNSGDDRGEVPSGCLQWCCESPLNSTFHVRLATRVADNPLKHDKQLGNIKHFPRALFFNMGMFPRTWQVGFFFFSFDFKIDLRPSASCV
jgi:hypothetical protein